MKLFPILLHLIHKNTFFSSALKFFSQKGGKMGKNNILGLINIGGSIKLDCKLNLVIGFVKPFEISGSFIDGCNNPD